MSFDAKINNENMTKCLQSLKEMYQDLDTREVYCPNEAEFRQYNVLLKMNDGDMLRSVYQPAGFSVVLVIACHLVYLAPSLLLVKGHVYLSVDGLCYFLSPNAERFSSFVRRCGILPR